MCSTLSPLGLSCQSLSCVRLFVTPWTALHQASLSFTISQSLLKLMSIELVMPSNHFGHLMQRTDSLEKTLMLGGIGGQEDKGTTEDEMRKGTPLASRVAQGVSGPSSTPPARRLEPGGGGSEGSSFAPVLCSQGTGTGMEAI